MRKAKSGAAGLIDSLNGWVSDFSATATGRGDFRMLMKCDFGCADLQSSKSTRFVSINRLHFYYLKLKN